MLTVGSMSVAVLCVLAIVLPLEGALKAPEFVVIEDSVQGNGFMYKGGDSYSVTFSNANKDQVKVLPGPKNVTITVEGVIALGKPLQVNPESPSQQLWNADNAITHLKTIIRVTFGPGIAFGYGAQKTADGATGQMVNGTLFVSFIEP